MSAPYTVVTLDGQEHIVPDLRTLKQWYLTSRLRAESLVLSPEIGQWKMLKNVFDLAQWEAEERATRGQAH